MKDTERRNTSMPHFTVLYFIALRLYKLNTVATLYQASLFNTIFPTAFGHFMSLCHVLVILVIFQTVSLLFSVICDQGEIFDVIYYYGPLKTQIIFSIF